MSFRTKTCVPEATALQTYLLCWDCTRTGTDLSSHLMVLSLVSSVVGSTMVSDESW